MLYLFTRKMKYKRKKEKKEKEIAGNYEERG